jgi:hypothetical protein
MCALSKRVGSALADGLRSLCGHFPFTVHRQPEPRTSLSRRHSVPTSAAMVHTCWRDSRIRGAPGCRRAKRFHNDEHSSCRRRRWSATLPLASTPTTTTSAALRAPHKMSNMNAGSSNDGEGAFASRTRMACLPCRQSKHKCDGQAPQQLVDAPPGAAALAQDSGSRCIWTPKAKLGRPSKRRRADDEFDWDLGGDSSFSPEITGTEALRSALGLDISLDTLPLSFASPSGVDDMFQFLTSSFAASSRAPSLSLVSQPRNEFTSLLTHPHFSAAFNRTSDFCPIISSRERFFARFEHWAVISDAGSRVDSFDSEAASLLAASKVILAIGHRIGEGPECCQRNETYLADARQSVEGLLNRPGGTQSFHSTPYELLHVIQALLLSVYLEFGMGNIPAAQRQLEHALQYALSAKLHQFDASPDPTYGILANLDGFPISADSLAVQAEEGLGNDLRLAFWEVSSSGEAPSADSRPDASSSYAWWTQSSECRLEKI